MGRGCKLGLILRVFSKFTKSPEAGSDEGNLENVKNTSGINPKLHKGTLRLHVYHIKGKIIEETHSMPRQMTRFHSVRVLFNSHC